eukprot:m51a1_g9540 hypothetical protein (602) ;mRNA; r:837748-840719
MRTRSLVALLASATVLQQARVDTWDRAALATSCCDVSDLALRAGAQDPEDKSTTCEAAGAHVANVNADDQKTRGAAIVPPDTDAASANTDNALASAEPVGHIAVREGAGEASVTAQDQPIATQKPIGSIDNPCDMDGSSKVGYAPAAATDAVATQRAGEETTHDRESSSPQPAQSMLWKLATTKYAAAGSSRSPRPQKRTADAVGLHTPAEKRTRGAPEVMFEPETDEEDDVVNTHALGRGGDEYHGCMNDDEDDAGLPTTTEKRTRDAPAVMCKRETGDEYHGHMTDDEDDVPACARGNQRGHKDCACDDSAKHDAYEGAASDEGDESMADDDGGSDEDSEPEEEEEGSVELSEDERVSRRDEEPPQWALEGRALATTWEPRESDLLCDDGASDFEQVVQGCASDIHADNVMGSETFEARVCECGDWEGCTCTDGLYAPLGGRHKQTGRWFMHTLVRCPDVFYTPRGSHSHGGGGDGEDGGLRELLMCVGRLVHSEGAVWGQQQQQGAGQAAAAEAVAGEVEGHERAVREAMLGERAMQMPAEAGLDELHWFVGMLLWDRGVHLFDREHGSCSNATLALVWVGRYLCMARWTLRTNCLLI